MNIMWTQRLKQQLGLQMVKTYSRYQTLYLSQVHQCRTPSIGVMFVNKKNKCSMLSVKLMCKSNYGVIKDLVSSKESTFFL